MVLQNWDCQLLVPIPEEFTSRFQCKLSLRLSVAWTILSTRSVGSCHATYSDAYRWISSLSAWEQINCESESLSPALNDTQTEKSSLDRCENLKVTTMQTSSCFRLFYVPCSQFTRGGQGRRVLMLEWCDSSDESYPRWLSSWESARVIIVWPDSLELCHLHWKESRQNIIMGDSNCFLWNLVPSNYQLVRNYW